MTDTLEIIDSPLPYLEKLEFRETASLDLIVLHCTELPTLELSRQFGEQVRYEDGTGNSGHYYIDRNGAVYRYVSEERVARHVMGHNKSSIGVEIVNSGRYPEWFSSKHQVWTEDYTQVQITSLKNLLIRLHTVFPQIHKIARHSDLDLDWIPAEDDSAQKVRRRLDPGPRFPWDDISSFWQNLLNR